MGAFRNKIILFKGISIILVPLLILIFIELFLRLFNYGNNYSLFIEYKGDKDYLVFNPAAPKKYFTEEKIATRGNSEVFKKKKDDHTFRIFILGESTTIGYPYFHNGSFHRWLQYRLSHAYPDKKLEIINLSLTAVNSYTVLGFAREVVKYKPDAVLIYAGHNEYYGALGAASTQNLGSNPRIINFVLRLRNLKLTQLIINFNEGIKNTFGPGGIKAGGNRMQLMVAKQEIQYHSDLYEKGITQFRDNMDAIMDLFSKEHIPLFVSNLISNEKDLKPFISFEPDSKSSEFKANLTFGIKAFEEDNLNLAETYLEKANQQYGFSAICNYYLGKLTYKKNDFVTAKQYYLKAKDLDGLRFRAPEKFNEILAQLCIKYPDAKLVDTRAVFEHHIAHQIIGDELTVDHVHPDLKGYAIMSDVFCEAIEKSRLLTGTIENRLTFKQLLAGMPKSKVDSIAGLYRVLNLKKHWPYNEPHAADSIKIATYEEKLAYKLVFENIKWENIMNNLCAYYIKNGRMLEARNVLENLVLEYPIDADLYERIAMLSGELNDAKKVIFNFKKSFELSPSFNKAHYLFVTYLKSDKPLDAIFYIDYAINNNSQGFNLSSIKANTEQIIRLQKQYLKDTTNVSILLQTANLYAAMGNKEGAIKYAVKVLSPDPENRAALSLINQIKSTSDR